jgi:hypothetical protein
MSTLFTLRGVATVLVLLSLTLPLSRCQREKAFLRAPGAPAAAEATGQPVEFDYTYAHEWFQLDEWQGWIALLTFAWPVLALVARWGSRSLRESRWLGWLEAALALGGGYVIWQMSSIGERLVGAYVGISGMGVYFISAIRDLCLPSGVSGHAGTAVGTEATGSGVPDRRD